MNGSNQYKEEIISFPKLLKRYKIEIPIIQRDYAQGRKDKKEIRISFLNALHQSITEDKNIKLDFIYGSIVDGSFLPLDGQQRLTTLFLLYYYACIKDSQLNETNIELLSKFSYEIRISSRDFCKALISNPISVKNKEDVISNSIIDSSWFYLSWKKDPTIDAMIRTIDDIHERFFHVDNLWNKLNSDANPISFYFVELENIGLTDDLYIKMNARGKLLSSFENFKAMFQKYINDNKWEENKKPTELFSFKIDTKWTDYFWNNFKKNNSIDEAFIRFISVIAMIRLSIEKNNANRINLIQELNDKPNIVKPELFTETGFQYLVKCFEIYGKSLIENIDLNLPYPLWRHKPQNSFLSNIVFEDSASYTQKVLFYAQTEYLLKVTAFNSGYFQDWMRVIRNIVSRGNIEGNGKRPDIIRSQQTFDGVINLISELSEGCEDIYLYLSTKERFSSQFAKEQVDEEKIKAKLIAKDIRNKQIVFDAEDNDLLMGRINFVLDCTDFDSNVDNFNSDLFDKVQKVINKYFKRETNVTNDLRRALLTIEVGGQYEYYNYWWSYWYAGNANKRCLIDNFRVLEYYIGSKSKEYFKKLIFQLIDKEMIEIINQFTSPQNMSNWQIRLIKEVDLLNNNTSNYIAIPEDNSYCYLLKSKRPKDLDGCIRVE
jgi:hypothetical protein